MKGSEAPRGWICKTDPEGKRWEVVATGFRNQYDIDFNADGEMFTYDADMEWDLNTPVVSPHPRQPRHQRSRIRLAQWFGEMARLLQR